MLRIAEHFHDSDLGRQRQGNEDNLLRPGAAVRRRRRHGRRAGGRGRVGDGGRRVRGRPARRATRASASSRSSSAPTRASTSARAPTASARAWARRSPPPTSADDEVVVAHVGDSRCYLLRGGDLVRLTRDHSLVGELVARGKLTEEQAEAHPQRSVITRALGPEPSVQVDVDVFPARPGDLFLRLLGRADVDGPRAGASSALLQSGGSLDQVGRALIARRQRRRAGGTTSRSSSSASRRSRTGADAARRTWPRPRSTTRFTARRETGRARRAAAADAAARVRRRPDAAEAEYRRRARSRCRRCARGDPRLPDGAEGEAAAAPAREPPPRTAPLPDGRAARPSAAAAPTRRMRRALRASPSPRPAAPGPGRRLARLPARLLRRHGPHGRPDDHHLPRAAVRAARRDPALRAVRRLRRDARPGPAEPARRRSPTTSCARATTPRTS